MLRCAALVRRATRRNIPEDTILHSHRRENLKSYISMSFNLQQNYTDWRHLSVEVIANIFGYSGVT
jgi:hypothetical protein